MVRHRLPDPDRVPVGAVPAPHVRERVLALVLPPVRPVPVVLLVQTVRLVLALAQLVAQVAGAGEYGDGLVGYLFFRVRGRRLVPAVDQVDPRVTVVVVHRVALLPARHEVRVGVDAELFEGLAARGGAAEPGDGFEHSIEKVAAEETVVVASRVLLAPLLHA